jgi:hypothetical protein
MLQKGVKNKDIKFHSGFLPWPFASMVIDKDPSIVLPLLKSR